MYIVTSDWVHVM